MGSAVQLSQTYHLRIAGERLTVYKKSGESYEDHGKAEFWGECGHVGLRKAGWLAKHSGARRIALFKMGIAAKHFIEQVREEVEPRYRPPSRISLFNFDDIVIEEVTEEISEIPARWYERYEI